MIRSLAIFWGLTAAGLAAWVFGCGFLAGAMAHSWYDGACCSERDCSAYRGRVRESAGGYVLEDGRFVAYTDSRVRLSLDNEFHVCERADKSVICLYAPGRAS